MNRCRDARRERILGLLERLGLGAALLRSPANFAHYTGGADNRVDRADPSGVAAALVCPDGEWIVTDDIEAGRFREEQTPEMRVVEHPWYESAGEVVRELTGGASLGSDLPAAGERGISRELAPLRYVLDPDAIDRYRLVGADTAAALSETATALSPDTTEPEAAAELEAALRRRSLNAAVLLAGGRKRAARYRHPVPRADPDARLGGRSMLVASAERGGLYANVTRILEFDDSPESRRLQRACDNILARARQAARPGRTLAQAFEEIVGAYREEGFPEDWKEHHQGGVTGYASREVIATPHTRTEIRTGMAFAFNPSLAEPGGKEFAKAEETFLLSPDGPEILTEEGGD